MAESKRFYVGNLSTDITESDLRGLFDRFGEVEGIDLKSKKDIDGNVTATFAFVKVGGLSDSDVVNVIKQCNHLKWKKQIIRVQLAQESFMERLQKERQNSKATASESHQKFFERPPSNDVKTKQNDSKGEEAYDPLALVKSRVVTLDPSEKKQELSRRRYYSSSDDEGDASVEKTASGGGQNLLSKFETDFWNDCEDAAGRGQKRKFGVQDSNAKRLASVREHQNQFHQQKLPIKAGIEGKGSKVTRFGADDEEEEGSKPVRYQSGDNHVKPKAKKFEDPDFEEDVEEERRRNLKILERIVGKSESPKKLHKNENYDEEKVPENRKEEPSSDKKYWVSNSLSNAFSGTKASDGEGKSFSFGSSGNGSTGFSLLSRFGMVNDDESGIGKQQAAESKRNSRHSSNPFKYDSSDDENGGNSGSRKDSMVLDPMDLFAQKLKEKASASKGTSESFFFRHDDARFNEGCRFFTLSKSVDEMRTLHDEHRPVLAQIMKKKLKRKAKKLEKLSFDLKRVNRKGGIVKKKFKKKFQRK